MVACATVIAFLLGCFVVFSLLLKNTIKLGFFDDFDMSILVFLQNFKVNNLATSRSKMWPSY